jgi:hypothetical protein
MAYTGKRMAQMDLSRFLAGVLSESRVQLQFQEVTLNWGPTAKLPLTPGKKIAERNFLPS